MGVKGKEDEEEEEEKIVKCVSIDDTKDRPIRGGEAMTLVTLVLSGKSHGMMGSLKAREFKSHYYQ